MKIKTVKKKEEKLRVRGITKRTVKLWLLVLMVIVIENMYKEYKDRLASTSTKI